MMFTEVFKEVLTRNGVVSITSWANDEAHVANTWNTYLRISGEDKILIPAAWFNTTEENLKINERVIVTLGSPDVEGTIGMGTGFVIKGTGKFIDSGEEFDRMKEEFSFLTRVLEVTVTSFKQSI